MRSRISALTLALLVVLPCLLLALPLGQARAAELTLRFDGLGVYPELATANSQRWFRATVTWDTGLTDDDGVMRVNERIIAVELLPDTITYNAGYGGNMYSTSGRPYQNGAAVGVAVDGGDGNMTFTVGPFAGYNYSHLVGSVRTGRLGGANPASWEITFGFRFRVQWEKWDSDADAYVRQPDLTASGTYRTVPLSGMAGGSVGDSGEIMYWYASDGAGIDPLTVTSANPSRPDCGSGSSEYIFRCVYWSYIPTLTAVWRAVEGRLMPREGCRYADFDRYCYEGLANGNWADSNKVLAQDSNYGVRGRDGTRNWGYGIGDPHMDWIGSHQSNQEGIVPDPEVILILDNKFGQPYYMQREILDYNGKSQEYVYRYDMIPTNYMQALHNALRFPYDLTGSDVWDMFTEGLTGRPACNTYSSLPPGVHSYQFLATRDWDPPVGQITDDATGQIMTGKMMVAMFGQPGERLGAAFVVRQGLGVSDNGPAPSSGVGAQRFAYYFPGIEAGYGYPYDAAEYPKVNPGLSAFPYVPFGLSNGGVLGIIAGVYPNSQPNPFQALAGSVPWGPIVGPQPPSMWYTNDDTIWPNLVNVDPDNYVVANPQDIYDFSKRAPFRGGKWTTDTNLVFRINYTQSDNLSPQAAQIFIRKTDSAGNPLSAWTPFTMLKVDPTDTIYADGCVYYYQATAASLPGGGGAGDYQYYFSFSDGINTAIYPNRPPARPASGAFPAQPADPGYLGVPPGDNDWFWFRVNHKPVLTTPSLDPPSGPQGSAFVFRATYTDQDGMVGDSNPQGDRPFKPLIWIDLFGDVQGQMQVRSLAGSTITYEFAPPIQAGFGIPYPAGTFNPNGKPAMKVHFQTGAASGQEFTIVGNTANATTGTITVSGTLPAGIAPGDKFQVTDWFAANMEQVDPTDTNYYDGVEYFFDTARAGMVLDPGLHNYFFEFWDNWAYWINWDQYFMIPGSAPTDLKLEGEMVRLPAAPGSYYEGPLVIGNRPPQLSKFYFSPPAADTVTRVVDATRLRFTRPLGRPAYADGSLVGKFLQFQTGLAALRVYRITANTANSMTVTKASGAGDLVADRVVLGDTFRIFDNYDPDLGLSGAYHQDPDTVFDGTPATAFRLFVTYSDVDNTPPASIRVAVYSSETQAANSPDAVYDMVKVDPAATNFVAGVEYRSATTVSLPPGRHWIRAQANDGAAWAGGGASADDWFGPAIDLANPAIGPSIVINHPPNPPVSGFSPADRISVNTANPTLRWDPATDPDPGDSVVRYTVQVSKTGFANGAFDYQYTTTTNTVQVTDNLTDLTMWSWRVKSEDMLGAMSVWSEIQEFFVDLQKLPPTLTPPNNDPAQTLAPLTGDLSTDFVYSIVYTDLDNRAPVSGVYVEIDGNLYPTPMNQADPTDVDYTDGALFTITIRGDSPALGYGRHVYRFYSGAVSWPLAADPVAVGPWIDSPSTISINDATWTPVTQVEEGSILYLQVTDPDKKPRRSVNVAVVAETGDQETVTLNQTGANTGVFRGTIRTRGNTGVSGDGILNVIAGAGGRLVTATYTDADTLDSPAPDVSSAQVRVVDTTAPPLVRPYLVVSSGPQGVSALLDWSTYPAPPDLAGYHVWFSNTAFDNVRALTPVATLAAGETTYEITGLAPGNIYYVAVTAFDEVPNEDTDERSRSVRTADTVGPTVSDQSPVPDATEVPLNTTISFNLNDPGGINLGSIQVFVAGADVSSRITKQPSTGTPTQVLVTYVGSFTWNQVVRVQVIARDRSGNQSDTTWRFTILADRQPPQVTDLSPPQGATDVSPSAPVSFHLRDAVSGVDVGSIQVLLNGTNITADLQINPTNLNDVVVTYAPPGGLPFSRTDYLKISARDRAGNAMETFTWFFTTQHAIMGRVVDQAGQPKPGVTVTNGIISAVTNDQGRYVLLGVADGTYTVVPTLEFFGFEPPSRRVTVRGASVSGISFTARPLTYSVSGMLQDWAGNPIAGITVGDGTRTTTTNALGRYTLAGLTPGNVTITPTSPDWSFVPASQTVAVPTTASIDFTGYRAFQLGLPAGLSMVGIPFDPVNRDPVALFGTNALRRWNPNASPPGYVGPDDPGSAQILEARPGRSWWVQYPAPHTVAGFGTPVSTTGPFVMSMGPAWNMLANPFLVNLPVANLLPAIAGGTDPYVFVWDRDIGNYLIITPAPGINVARTFVRPWEGMWLRSLVGNTSVSATPPVGAAEAESVEPQALDVGEGGYVIPVVARAGTRADVISAAGVSAAGAYEVANPPAVSGTVDVYFVDEAGNPLAQQIKPLGEVTQSWKFVVATDLPRTEVALSLPDLSQVPNDLSVTLVDEDAGRSMYMRTTAQYVFKTGVSGAVRHFRLEVAPRSGDNLVLSAASAQQAGAGVVVTYTVSQACRVNVDVLNIAGRVVRRLSSDAAAGAGVNTVTWNLRSDGGSAVPAGVYLVRIRATAENGQRVEAVAQVNVTR